MTPEKEAKILQVLGYNVTAESLEADKQRNAQRVAKDLGRDVEELHAVAEIVEEDEAREITEWLVESTNPFTRQDEIDRENMISEMRGGL